MTLKRLLLACLVCLLAIPGFAQTTTAKLQWAQPLSTGQALVDVQGFAWTLKVDTGTPTIAVATCVAGTPILCTTPLPALPSGAHTLTLTATNGFGSASGSLSGNSPASPINISVTVTVTVP